MKSKDIKLKRELGLASTTLYGLGNILGAGIYALIGVIAIHAGYFTPISFIIALLLAFFTALSYMELSSRYPLSSGEAIYIFKAFSWKYFSVLIGLLIALAGLISSATMLKSFVGYFHIFSNIPSHILIISIVIVIGAISIWGINESVGLASAITLIEVAGLLMIIWVAKSHLINLPTELPKLIPPAEISIWNGIFIGAFVAFYAFIGFEDMVTIAEEVKKPRIHMPLAIFFALAIATVLYISVSIIAVLAINPTILAQSKAPMSLVYEASTNSKPILITLISMFAVLNGSLVQIVKASRLIYGMSVQKWLPKIFSNINPITRTPILATVIVTLIILFLALNFPIEKLAEATSFTVLLVFGVVNFALFKIKIQNRVDLIHVPEIQNQKIISFPVFIPFLGFLFSFAIIIFKILN